MAEIPTQSAHEPKTPSFNYRIYIMRGIYCMPYTLLFERAKKAFHGGIIPAIAFSRHTHDHPCLFESLPIGSTGVLAPAITVVQQPRLGATTCESQVI